MSYRFLAQFRSARGRGARLLTCLALLSATTLALADPPALVGRLAWFEGKVALRLAADGLPAETLINWPLTSGDAVATRAGARTEVWLGSIAVRIDSSSTVSFERVDENQLVISLRAGTIALRIPTDTAARRTRIKSDDAIIAPAQPGDYRIERIGDLLVATALNGKLDWRVGDSTLQLLAGQRCARKDGKWPVERCVLSTPANDGFQQFVRDRDQHFAGRVALNFVSPEMTGAEILDSHGYWVDTADLGPVWMPDVPAGWIPYRNGRWVNVPPWGQTWIADDAWGFAPFHYGRWTRRAGRWAWWPGRWTAMPVYAPALIGRTEASHTGDSQSKGMPSTTHEGWFPLAPGDRYVPLYPASTEYERRLNSDEPGNATSAVRLQRNTAVVDPSGW